MAGLAVVLVLVAGVVGLPQLLTGGGQSPTSASGGAEAGSGPETGSGPESGSAPEADTRSGDYGQPDAVPPGRQGSPTSTDPAPTGWRTEYYRDISFEVPASWGYAVPPQSDWCVDKPRGELRADQRRPYVWLGSNVLVRGVGCPAMPGSLLSEHVEAHAPGPAVDYAEGAVRQGDWWVVTRFAGSAVLVVTTKDRARAEQILDSAQVEPEGAPCASRSPIAGELGAPPADGLDLGRGPRVDRVVLCQYQPVLNRADAKLPSLRAAVRLSAKASRALVDQLAAAPVNDKRCDPAPVQQGPDLAVVVRIEVDGRVREVYVRAVGCPDGDDGMSGGIDDGTTVRVLTRPACQRLLTPPLAVWAAGGDLARNCQG
jgi:hypothetical protein